MLRKFFIKRFRAYAIIMIIPLLILFFIMGWLIVNEEQNKFKAQGTDTIQRINDNIVYVVYSTIHQQDIMLNNAGSRLSLQKLLSHDRLEYNDVVFMNTIKNFLKSFEASYPYMNSIYLYINGFHNYLTSYSEQLVSVERFYDKEWINTYIRMPEEDNHYIEARSIKRYEYEESKKVITIYQRMTYTDGVIVVNINSDDFGKMIDSMLYNSEQSLFYLNTNGDILFSNNKEIENSVDIKNKFFNNIISEYKTTGEFKKQQEWINLDGKYYLFCIEPADYYDTYLVSMLSFSVFIDNLKEYINIALIILFSIILLVMVLAWITTESAFKHINYLIDVFGAAERGEVIEKPQSIVKDEYNLIMNNILFLFIENNQMQTNLLEKQHQNEISELMALQLQINPHFIFNTLQTMDLEVLKQLGRQSTLHIMIQELSRIIKYALTTPMELVTLKEELDYLKAYIRIQEIRFKNNIITYFEIEKDLLKYPVFRLMLQPIVENSVSHGIKSSDERFYMKIKIFSRNNYMHIFIVDSGCGMTKEEINIVNKKINNPKSKNIGLTNLNRRLMLHYGDYSKIRIRSKKNMGTEISFRIPIEGASK